MTLQLTKSGIGYGLPPEELQRLSDEFRTHHCVLLKEFIEAKLLHLLQCQIENARFSKRFHKAEGASDLCMKQDVTEGLLHFLMNDPRLFRLLERITGCPAIGSFVGSVYKLKPSLNHFWHDDCTQTRLLALSVNFSTGIYRGGILQIREQASRRIVREVANTGFGDAVLFRLSPELEHRVSGVEGPVVKTAFAGWFKEQPAYRSYAKEILLAQRKP